MIKIQNKNEDRLQSINIYTSWALLSRQISYHTEPTAFLLYHENIQGEIRNLCQ